MDYFNQIGGEHEQVIDIIDSIRTDAGRVYSANLPNLGQVANFPLHAILESPAVADAGGLRHIAQPSVPSALASTLAGRLAWVELIVDAALEGSREKFIQALVVDGWVSSLPKAIELADELLAAQVDDPPLFAEANGKRKEKNRRKPWVLA